MVSTETHLTNLLYHFGPPLVVGLLVFWLGRKMKKQDDLRLREATELHTYREETRHTLRSIYGQNSWFIRKFVELATMHNMKHNDARIDVEDYPNGFNRPGND